MRRIDSLRLFVLWPSLWINESLGVAAVEFPPNLDRFYHRNGMAIFRVATPSFRNAYEALHKYLSRVKLWCYKKTNEKYKYTYCTWTNDTWQYRLIGLICFLHTLGDDPCKYGYIIATKTLKIYSQHSWKNC